MRIRETVGWTVWLVAVAWSAWVLYGPEGKEVESAEAATTFELRASV